MNNNFAEKAHESNQQINKTSNNYNKHDSNYNNAKKVKFKDKENN